MASNSVASHRVLLKVRITEAAETNLYVIRQTGLLLHGNARLTRLIIAFYCKQAEDKELSMPIYKKKIFKGGNQVS
jgi:hypothetical protein